MNKICTTLEQSKKLIELGIDTGTADMTVTNYPLQDGNRFYFICCKLPNDEFPSITDGKSEKIPAWSLSALLSVLPQGTRLLKSATDEMYHCDCPKGNINKWFDNPIDAAFEMIVWLKENKKT